MGVLLQIRFQNESRTFYPGQVVRGNVLLSNDTDIKVKGLTVTFFGEAEVYWTESQTQYDTASLYRSESQQRSSPARRHVHKEFRNQETFLCHEIILFGNADYEGGEETTIQPGEQIYPFEIQLPINGLPSTFNQSPFGFVKYTAETRLRRSLFRYDRSEVEFFVNGIFDLNFVPSVLEPIVLEKQEELGWPCCPTGFMMLSLNLPKTGYIPGEELKFFVRVLTSVPVVHLTATLVQGLQFITFDRKKAVSTKLQFASYGSRIDSEATAWDTSFILPNSLLPTNLAGCRIISITYELIVETKESRGKVIRISAPITIGSEPCSLHPSSIPPILEVPQSQRDSPVFRCGTTVPAEPPHSLRGAPPQKLQNEVLLNNNNFNDSSTVKKYNHSLNPFLDSDSEDNGSNDNKTEKEQTIGDVD